MGRSRLALGAARAFPALKKKQTSIPAIQPLPPSFMVHPESSDSQTQTAASPEIARKDRGRSK